MGVLGGFRHTTVLGEATAAALKDVPAGWVVDCTLGGGGHSELVLRSVPQARVIGIDRDPTALEAASARLAEFGDRFVAAHAAFADFDEVCAAQQASPLVGVIADLGVSSHQLDTDQRGFSFRHDGPLDMRMDTSRGETLADLLSKTSKRELADVLYHYGDVRASHRVADAILDAMQAGVSRTGDLADRIARVLPRGGRVHPATQAFQALRIWVNDELEQLEQLLAKAPRYLVPGGVVAIISFHSGEDRAVKQVFRDLSRGKHSHFHLPQRKPVLPTEQEIAHNPRARSAKLRVLRRKTPSRPVQEVSP